MKLILLVHFFLISSKILCETNPCSRSFSPSDIPKLRPDQAGARKGHRVQKKLSEGEVSISEDGADSRDLAHAGCSPWPRGKEAVSREPARVLHLLQHLRQCLQNTQTAGVHPHLLPGVPLPPHGYLWDRGGQQQPHRSPLLPLLPPSHHAAWGGTASSDHQSRGPRQASSPPAAWGAGVARWAEVVLQDHERIGCPRQPHGPLCLHRYWSHQGAGGSNPGTSDFWLAGPAGRLEEDVDLHHTHGVACCHCVVATAVCI